MLRIHGLGLNRVDAKELRIEDTRILVQQIGMPHIGVPMMRMVGMIEAFGAKSTVWNLAAYISWFSEQLP
jgi:hypothetical protein